MENKKLQKAKEYMTKAWVLYLLTGLLALAFAGYVVRDMLRDARLQAYQNGFGEGFREATAQAASSTQAAQNAAFGQGFINARNAVYQEAKQNGEVVVGISPEEQIILMLKPE